MKRLIAMSVCAVWLTVLPSAAMAQPTKSVKGSITAMAGGSITVKVADKDMTFAVDDKTHVVVPGGSTKTRGAQAEGKAGPALNELLKTGQAVEVSYHEQGMHAATNRGIAAVPPPPPAAPAAKSQTTRGMVSAVSGNSVTIKGAEGESVFVVDAKTSVVGVGMGTAAKKATEAKGSAAITDLVHTGDTVSVTYKGAEGAKTASIVRVIRKKP